MNRSGPGYRTAVALLATALLAAHGGRLYAQVGSSTPGGQFELSDGVQLDLVDHSVLAQCERAKALLGDRQWDEGVEILRQLAESPDTKLLGVTSRRYVSLGQWCQLQLAVLPPEALKLYRARVDPVAHRWYDDAIARRNPRLLEDIVQEAFASSYGDDALLALGDIALESGDYASARWYWERILPHAPPTGVRNTWPGYPDTSLDLAAVRARIVLASILEGATERAREELVEFARLHPNAVGRLGNREGKFVDSLRALLAEAVTSPQPPTAMDWLTLAGNFERNGIARPLVDVGAVAWRVPLRSAVLRQPLNVASTEETVRQPPSYYPVLAGDIVLANDGQQITAVRLDTGKPAWGQATIYRGETDGETLPTIPSDTLGVPRFTMSVFEGKLLARMGWPITNEPQDTTASVRRGYLVCLDLAAEGRLLWKIEPEEGWAFEGSPVADAQGVYVAMRRHDIRPQAFVACFDSDTGRLRWRQLICSAQTPAHGSLHECTHNLLTLCGKRLYYNTNLGAVAALRTENGRPLWVALYPRDRHGDLANLAPHWLRDLNPCLMSGNMVFVAPADSPRIFAFDAFTGQMLWQTESIVDDAAYLLGVAGDWLIAGGRKLYWISLKDETRGRVQHVWPTGENRPGYGRGVLSGNSVLWPTRDKLMIFDQQAAEPRKAIDLVAHDASGGNLVVGKRRLLITTATELIAISPGATITRPPSPPQLVDRRRP